jgi:hypothetical protein
LKNDPGQTRNHAIEHPEVVGECRKMANRFWPSIEFP